MNYLAIPATFDLEFGDGEKASARRKLASAVRRGQVEKPASCEACGSTDALHGHHEDYSRPLNARWLCPSCHRAEHAGRPGRKQSALLTRDDFDVLISRKTAEVTEQYADLVRLVCACTRRYGSAPRVPDLAFPETEEVA